MSVLYEQALGQSSCFESIFVTEGSRNCPSLVSKEQASSFEGTRGLEQQQPPQIATQNKGMCRVPGVGFAGSSSVIAWLSVTEAERPQQRGCLNAAAQVAWRIFGVVLVEGGVSRGNRVVLVDSSCV